MPVSRLIYPRSTPVLSTAFSLLFSMLASVDAQAQTVEPSANWADLSDILSSREAGPQNIAPVQLAQINSETWKSDDQWFNEGSTSENQYVRQNNALFEAAYAKNWSQLKALSNTRLDAEGRFYYAMALAQTGNVPRAVSVLDESVSAPRVVAQAVERYRTTLLQYQNKPPAFGAEPLSIAVLLPLSGKHKAIGEALLNAMQLALFEAYPNVTLFPYDTGSGAPLARTQAEKALRTNVKAIIGPLFSAQVDAIRPVVRRHNVPVLALSSDRQVAGENIHIFNYRPDAQTTLVTQHALGQGAKTFAALVPATPYGYDVLDVFQKAVATGGGRVANVAFFNPSQADITTALNQLFTKPKGEDHERTEFTAPYDALFLPTDAAHLPLVLSQMALYDVDRVQMLTLGTAAWTDKDTRGGKAYLRDGRFPLPLKDAPFLASYEENYGKPAPQIAQVAYDAVQVLATAHSRAGGLQANLLHPAGFSTLSGPIRFMENGLPERFYPLYQLTQRKFVHAVPPLTQAPPPLPYPLNPLEKLKRKSIFRTREAPEFERFQSVEDENLWGQPAQTEQPAPTQPENTPTIQRAPSFPGAPEPTPKKKRFRFIPW